jgi:hypothetical protein
MDGNFVNFRAVYDLLTDEVMNCRAAFLAQHLSNWFERLDNTPGIDEFVHTLEEALDFEGWQKEREETVGSFIGSGELRWPKGREKRIGIQLLLFRRIASEQMDAFDFAHNYFYPGTNRIDDTVRELTDQVFGPMARDLRLLLEERVAENESGDIPASNRLVKLDHNSPKYKEAINALEVLERVLRESNDYPDLVDKEQKIAEVSATQRLLQAARVRVGAVLALAKTPLLYLAKQFGNAGIGVAAKFAWEKIVAALSLLG